MKWYMFVFSFNNNYEEPSWKPLFASKSEKSILWAARLLQGKELLFAVVASKEGILNLLDNLGTGAVRADFWNPFPVLWIWVIGMIKSRKC